MPPELPNIRGIDAFPLIPTIDLNSIESIKKIMFEWSPYQPFCIIDVENNTNNYYSFICITAESLEPHMVSPTVLKGIKNITVKASHLGSLTPNSPYCLKKSIVREIKKSLSTRDFVISLTHQNDIKRIILQSPMDIVRFYD